MPSRSKVVTVGDSVRCTATGQQATVQQIWRCDGGLVYTLAPGHGGTAFSVPSTEWEPVEQPYPREGEQHQ